jgi:lysyl-tRNA synthetase class 1
MTSHHLLDDENHKCREAAESSPAWPFEEARKIVDRLKRLNKKTATFATGYGPSGLPHMGTFGEVVRTSMVRHAFRILTNDQIPTHLIVFSDDMDGLRKVPDNVPNQDLLKANLNKPLTSVPDPFACHESFAHHNNAMLRSFLDSFGFKYTFLSATECYQTGVFDAMLMRVLENYASVQKIMLPTLGEERRQTYSPFLPIHPETGHVLQVPIDSIDVKKGSLIWTDPETGQTIETPVTGGNAKLQWKPDWAMRWCALGVDYEMAGKDLIDSVALSSKIARVLGETPPVGFNYELFLDQNGQKISKSKGNGLTIEEWLTYGPPESLAFFMYHKPREAKRLSLSVVPRCVDEYLSFLKDIPNQAWPQRLGNPVWHIHGGQPPKPERIETEAVREKASAPTLTFGMLCNLAAAAHPETPEVLWKFIRHYAPSTSPENHPQLASLVNYAWRYWSDLIRAHKVYTRPSDKEAEALKDLKNVLQKEGDSTDGEALQALVYDIGRKHFPKVNPEKPDAPPSVGREWFQTLYRILLGDEQGPRFGSFIALYGVNNTCDLINRALRGELK